PTRTPLHPPVCHLALPLSLPPLSHAPAPPQLSPLPLHDALPISPRPPGAPASPCPRSPGPGGPAAPGRLRPETGWDRPASPNPRSEEHTSELQSRFDLVCRLLLEKKKQKTNTNAADDSCGHIQMN